MPENYSRGFGNFKQKRQRIADESFSQAWIFQVRTPAYRKTGRRRQVHSGCSGGLREPGSFDGGNVRVSLFQGNRRSQRTFPVFRILVPHDRQTPGDGIKRAGGCSKQHGSGSRRAKQQYFYLTRRGSAIYNKSCSETYRSGHNEPHSKCGCPQGHVGSNPTVSAWKMGSVAFHACQAMLLLYNRIVP